MGPSCAIGLVVSVEVMSSSPYPRRWRGVDGGALRGCALVGGSLSGGP